METQTTTSNNMAAIAYLTIIGLVIAFVTNQENKEELTSFHVRQSLGLGLTAITISILGIIPFLGWIISIVGTLGILVLWIIGLMNAINHKKEYVPILGRQYEEWFQNL